jgi:diguanylate cyclase (GGDEF)-like protein
VLFGDRLAHAVAMHARDGRDVAVLALDLDDFKLINDSLGHPVGDAVLIEAAERLQRSVRTGDTVARLGGDQFAVLLEGGVEPAVTAAERILEAFDTEFSVGEQSIDVRPSAGLAELNRSVTTGLTSEELLKRANVALYSAKRTRTGGIATFSEDMKLVDTEEVEPPCSSRAHDARVGGMRLLSELRTAISDGELSAVYQPKYHMATGRIIGVEALVRWPHPRLGTLLPDQFLPIARQNGLMGALTELVLHRAADDAVEWHAMGFPIPFAINLFPPSLNDLSLASTVAGVMADHHLPFDHVTVEITEDLVLSDPERAREVLIRLHEFGIRVALDDFGSGYSALNYLIQLPIDELKLDMNLVAPIAVDPPAAIIVRKVIELTRELGMVCVAEGVENSATADLLISYGCEVAQGYYYSPPVTADALQRMLSGQRTPIAARTPTLAVPAQCDEPSIQP